MIFDDIEIKLYPNGSAIIDTFIPVPSDDCGCGESHNENLRATFNINCGFGERIDEEEDFYGEVFSWVGFFVYERVRVIDIDPF